MCMRQQEFDAVKQSRWLRTVLGEAFSKHASAAFVHISFTAPCLQDDAADAQWFDVADPPQLAFDHKLVLCKGFEHLIKHAEAQQTGLPSCSAWQFWA